jgi:hypothetical protein
VSIEQNVPKRKRDGAVRDSNLRQGSFMRRHIPLAVVVWSESRVSMPLHVRIKTHCTFGRIVFLACDSSQGCGPQPEQSSPLIRLRITDFSLTTASQIATASPSCLAFLAHTQLLPVWMHSADIVASGSVPGTLTQSGSCSFVAMKSLYIRLFLHIFSFSVLFSYVETEISRYD